MTKFWNNETSLNIIDKTFIYTNNKNTLNMNVFDLLKKDFYINNKGKFCFLNLFELVHTFQQNRTPENSQILRSFIFKNSKKIRELLKQIGNTIISDSAEEPFDLRYLLLSIFSELSSITNLDLGDMNIVFNIENKELTKLIKKYIFKYIERYFFKNINEAFKIDIYVLKNEIEIEKYFHNNLKYIISDKLYTIYTFLSIKDIIPKKNIEEELKKVMLEMTIVYVKQLNNKANKFKIKDSSNPFTFKVSLVDLNNKQNKKYSWTSISKTMDYSRNNINKIELLSVMSKELIKNKIKPSKSIQKILFKLFCKDITFIHNEVFIYCLLKYKVDFPLFYSVKHLGILQIFFLFLINFEIPSKTIFDKKIKYSLFDAKVKENRFENTFIEYMYQNIEEVIFKELQMSYFNKPNVFHSPISDKDKQTLLEKFNQNQNIIKGFAKMKKYFDKKVDSSIFVC
jgi:hypothetical protein